MGNPARNVAWVAAAALLIHCSDGPTGIAGGGGVETTGGNLVAMVGGSGSSAAGARVRLVPEDYRPAPDAEFPDSLTAIADDSGHYAFRKAPAGRYNLEAVLPKAGVRLLRRGIELGAKPAALGLDTLQATARLSLHWASARAGFFYLTGTTWSRAIPDAEALPVEYMLDSLPAGFQPPIRHRSGPTDTASRILTDSLLLRPGGLVRWEVLEDWAHSARLLINTTPSGADVSEAVEDFPLLVRLFADDFDFAQAAPGGRDLRFTDADGSPLPHTIQRWDSVGGKAEIWVRVPKVDGNSDQDQIILHWGHPGSPDPITAPVFDRSGGFTALWHLDENGNTAPGGYADAIGSHPGTAPSTIDFTFTEGLIVGGLKLDGSKVVAVAPSPDLNSLPALTLSAWIKSDLWTGGDRTILQKGSGTGQYGLSGFTDISDATDSDSLEFRLSVGGVAHALRALAPLTGEPHLAQATFDGREARLYLDGVLRRSEPVTGALTVSNDSLYIGHKPGGADSDHFQGLLDEISISHVARSPQWLKLAYETQKQGSKVLRLEPIK
jgi:hypothetical protein